MCGGGGEGERREKGRMIAIKLDGTEKNTRYLKKKKKKKKNEEEEEEQERRK